MTNQTPDHAAAAADVSHPDVDTLADLSEDLLAPAEAEVVRTHLAGCPECADTLAALTEVAALLAADPVEPMPADVALRIDAALAAAQPPTVPATPDAPAPAPSVHRADAARATAGPPARTDHSRRPTGSRRRRRRLVLALAGGLAVLGLGAGLVLSRPSTTSPTAAGAAHPATAQHPLSPLGPEFTAAGLPEQIHRLLPAGAGVQPHTGARPDEGTPTGVTLPECVQQAVAGHQGESPVLTAHGSLQGAPVDVYVFRLAADPTRLDVFLLTPGCTADPATVRLEQQIPAH